LIEKKSGGNRGREGWDEHLCWVAQEAEQTKRTHGLLTIKGEKTLEINSVKTIR